MTTENTETITTSVPVSFTLERVKWSYMTTEDYYVRYNDYILGIIGYDNDRKGWWSAEIRYKSGRKGYPSYVTLQNAVRALAKAKLHKVLK